MTLSPKVGAMMNRQTDSKGNLQRTESTFCDPSGNVTQNSPILIHHNQFRHFHIDATVVLM